MALQNPKISVIIPAYNAEAFIEKTLDSVFNQTLKPHEVIVVDDGSTDNTSSIVDSYDIKYVKQGNKGTATALNNGIKHASGNVLALLDHDDIWLPKKLELQAQILQERPTIDIVFTLLENLIVNEELKHKVDIDLGPVNGVHKSTFFVRKEKFLEVGLFSNQSGTQEFLDWFAKALDLGLNVHTIKEVLVKRTIHGTNQTLLNQSMKSDFPKVLKAILDRRRA